METGVVSTNSALKQLYEIGPSIELLKQKILLSKKEQDTSLKFHMWHGTLAGTLILVLKA